MNIWIDSADVAEIKQAVAMRLCDGVTTNPSLIAKTGRKNEEVIADICNITDVPVLAETVGISYEEIMSEGAELAKIADNVVVKIPFCKDGLRAVSDFADQGIQSAVTLVFNASQALLAAKAGAAYIAPFVGRVDDIGSEGMEVIAEIVQIYDWYDYDTEIIVASVRTPMHFKDSALAGAHAITVPFSLVDKLMKHPLTENGIAQFLADAGRK